MIRIFLVGALGRMGREITRLAEASQDLVIVGGLDQGAGSTTSFPIFTVFPEIDLEYDVLIDFSSPALTDALLDHLHKSGKPAVLCTTGISAEQESAVSSLATQSAIFRSANMSVGVYVLSRLVAEANRLLGAEFDAEIVEAHHRGKKDSPSGTAFMLARAIQQSSEIERPLVLDRSNRSEARPTGEIGMQALRGGTIAGDHQVLFAGDSEVITLAHHAQSRDVFAAGALRAARFIHGKTPGLYDMSDMLA